MGQEVSTDLMRHHRDAPKSVMEVMLYVESDNAAGRLLYERGTPLYNFQGLRAFKSKFDPVWESRYLVYPSGLALLHIAADVSALVSGGYRRIFAK